MEFTLSENRIDFAPIEGIKTTFYKVCPNCDIIMPSENWTVDKKRAGGYLPVCNDCLSKATKDSKVCSKCGFLKPKQAYSADLRNTSTGLQSECKDCKNRRRRELKDRAKVNAYAREQYHKRAAEKREYYQRHRDEINARRRQRRKALKRDVGLPTSHSDDTPKATETGD